MRKKAAQSQGYESSLVLALDPQTPSKHILASIDAATSIGIDAISVSQVPLDRNEKRAIYPLLIPVTSEGQFFYLKDVIKMELIPFKTRLDLELSKDSLAISDPEITISYWLKSQELLEALKKEQPKFSTPDSYVSLFLKEKANGQDFLKAFEVIQKAGLRRVVLEEE